MILEYLSRLELEQILALMYFHRIKMGYINDCNGKVEFTKQPKINSVLITLKEVTDELQKFTNKPEKSD